MNYDYLLKFDSEEQANSVLFSKVPTTFNEEGEATEWMDKPNYDNTDIIGAIYKPTGEINEEGNPVMVDVGGYHVNVRNYSEAPELNAYVVVTNNPYRTWAGE
jgi:hypothetical protein